MRIIDHLAHQIKDEVDGVCGYAKDALEYKVMRPKLSQLYYQLANTEYNHVEQLHNAVMEIVKEIDASGVEYPAEMRQKWDEKHKKIIAKMAEAKTYLGMYK